MTQLEKLSTCPFSPDNQRMFSTRLDQMLDRFVRIRQFSVPVAGLFDALEGKCQQDHDGYLELQKTFNCQ